jgi:hypothetical protein
MGTVADVYGNLLAETATSPAEVVDTVNPTGQISDEHDGKASDTVNTVTYNVSFSEAIQSFDPIADLTITNATYVDSSLQLTNAGAPDGVSNEIVGAKFTVLADDNSDQNIEISVNQSIVDQVGNALVTIVDTEQEVDTINPEVAASVNDVADSMSVSDVDPTVEYTVTFTEQVSSLTVDDINAVGATVDSVELSKDGLTATVIVTADDNSSTPMTISVGETATDMVDNIMVANVSTAQSVDTINPTVTIEESFGTAVDDNIVSDDDQPVSYTVTFSEPIQSFTEADIDTGSNGLLQPGTIVNLTDDDGNITGATFNVMASDGLEGELQVKINNSVVDLSGNTLDQNNNTVTVDTLNPEVTVSLSNQSAEGDSYNYADYDNAEGDNGIGERVHPLLTTTVESNASYVVELTHVATATTLLISTDQSGAELIGDGNSDIIYLSASEIDQIGQGEITVSVVATDLAGNTSEANLGNESLVLKTGTFLMENGVVSLQQVKGVNGDGYQSDSTIIRPFDGSLSGEGDTIDFSQELGDTDITYVAEAGFATSVSSDGSADFVGIETNNPDTPEHEAFETIVTGDGNDALYGSGLASETFRAGAGDNYIDAGDSADTADTVSYEDMVNTSSRETTSVAGVEDTVNGTLRFTVNQTGNYRVTLPTSSGSESIMIQLNQLSDLANIVTVIAASSQLVASTVNAEIVDDNVIQLSVPDGSDTAMTISEFSQVFSLELVTPIQGVVADLSADSGGSVGVVDVEVTRGDGGSDIIVGIENVLGSNFDDVLSGDTGVNTLSGGEGMDILRFHKSLEQLKIQSLKHSTRRTTF